MIIETLLALILIGLIALVVVVLLIRIIGKPETYTLQRELDLRLTYKRYMQIYPSSNISYQEYKKMQADRAYKKAVSSIKNKRMVR